MGSIVFIDSRVKDLTQFAATLAPGTEWFVLDSQHDGIAQIATIMAERSGISAVHIVSHGASGTLQLGSTLLTNQNLHNYLPALNTLGNSLTANADLLLYGCDVASGLDGLAFMNSLAQATGADIAASVDKTGATTQGANSVLEQHVGNIETNTLSMQTLSSTLPVNSTKITTDFGASDIARGVIQQSDGKLIVAGSTGGDIILTRYTTSLTLDTSFSQDGKVTTDFGGSDDAAYSLIQQSDSKFVVAGITYDEVLGKNLFAIVRYNASGSLDTSFNGTGRTSTNITGLDSSCHTIIQQSDGLLLAAGSTSDVLTGNNNFTLVRYSTDGSLDQNFATGGIKTTNINGNDEAFSVIQQSDGKILAVGESDGDFALVRYNIDGSLDQSFSTDGILTTDFGGNDRALDVLQQVDGKILVVGYTFDPSFSSSNPPSTAKNFAIARYNIDGSLDTTFSTDGLLTTDLGGLDEAHSVIQQADGKILVVGSTYTRDMRYSYFSFARYNLDGSLDRTLVGTGTKTETSAFNGTDTAYDIVQQTNGKLVVVGSSEDNFALARYRLDGYLDSGSAPTGDIVINGTAIQGQTLTVSSSLQDADGLGVISYQWLANGAVINGATTSNLLLGVALIGKVISVRASYRDQKGNSEIVYSATTDIVARLQVNKTNGADLYNGTQYDDWVFGKGGDDTLNGNMGNDTLDGGTGNDIINGGPGDDSMSGGIGNDTYYVGSVGDTVTEAVDSGLDLVYSSISYTLPDNVENLYLTGTVSSQGTGNSLNNLINGNSAGNHLNGMLGNDTMIGGQGNDFYYVNSILDVVQEESNEGIDTIISTVSFTLGLNQENLTLLGTGNRTEYGNSQDNILTGNNGNNKLTGYSGADTLRGGNGDDTLAGGNGADELTGGAGNDIFSFTSVNHLNATPSRTDVITDFRRGDKLDFSLIDANTIVADDQAFTAFVSGKKVGSLIDGFTAAGQLCYSGGILYLNTDTDAAPELTLVLIGVSSLSMDDIIG